MPELTRLSTITLNNGVEMPAIGYGTWRSEPGKAREGVKFALENGYIHIDAAHCYENHVEVGQGIQESGVPRDKIFITSKLWATHLRPENAKMQLTQILSELDVDYLDQFIIHWPTPFIYAGDNKFPTNEQKHIITDPNVDLKETWKFMEKTVEAGLCRSIGLSNCSIEEVKFFMEGVKIKPAVNQIEVHPYFNNAEVVDFCLKNGIHIVAYSPLGNHDPSRDIPSALKDEVILELSKKYSKSPAQIIIRWHLQNGVTVIPKSVTPSRIIENLDVFGFELSKDEMSAIQALGSRRYRTCNPRFRPNGELVWPEDTTAFE